MPKEKNQPLAVSHQPSGLKWNGKGSLSDIPARDLTDAEVKDFGGYEKLIASGCYEAINNEVPVQIETLIARGETLTGERNDIERLINRDSEE